MKQAGLDEAPAGAGDLAAADKGEVGARAEARTAARDADLALASAGPFAAG